MDETPDQKMEKALERSLVLVAAVLIFAIGKRDADMSISEAESFTAAAKKRGLDLGSIAREYAEAEGQ